MPQQPHFATHLRLHEVFQRLQFGKLMQPKARQNSANPWAIMMHNFVDTEVLNLSFFFCFEKLLIIT